MTPTPSATKSKFHFDLGQAIGLALLGLSVFAKTQQPGSSAASTLEDPNNLIQIVNGITAIFHSPQSTEVQ